MRRPWLAPLVPLYGAGAWIAHRVRAQPGRLACPVISVGSLSAGGAGKTPVVATLGALLQRAGYMPDVLSRGFGRSSDAILRVDPNGDPQLFGDEPIELARTGLPVWVGANRLSAGQVAEAASPDRTSRIHLLDDGFQHRRLARALDLVLVTAEDIRDYSLPAGNLRESFRALRRADVLLLRTEEATGISRDLRLPAKPIWLIERRLTLPPNRPSRLLAFCGLARPASFFAMFSAAGAAPVTTIAFPDHHRYRLRDTARLIQQARHSGAEGFLTTAKDAVKLTLEHRAALAEVGPLLVAELEVRFLDEPAVLLAVREAIAKFPAHEPNQSPS